MFCCFVNTKLLLTFTLILVESLALRCNPLLDAAFR